MSTTSCPHCSGQVTLPVGVSNSATVRCPLCHAHYTLADALVNMPPLLEVVQDESEALPAEWYEAPPDDSAGTPLAAEAAPEAEPDQSDEEPLLASAADELEDEFSAGEIDFEDVEMEEVPAATGEDTQVDGLSFSTLESIPEADVTSSADDDDELLDLGQPPELSSDEDAPNGEGEGDLALDFGEPQLSAEAAGAETMEFGEEESLEAGEDLKFDLETPEAESESPAFDFGGAEPAADDDEVRFDLDQPADAEAATMEFQPQEVEEGEAVEFNFDAPSESDAADGELREFEEIRVDASGEADEIPLDLSGESAEAPAVASEPAEEAGGKKKGKKKKEKKPKAVKSGDKPKRSLVGTLVSVVLPAVIALPIALYALLWISPSLDFLGLADFLPRAMLPASFTKSKFAQNTQQPVTVQFPTSTEPEPTLEPTDDATAASEPTDEASGEHTVGRVPTPSDDADEMPAETPADEPPSLSPPETDIAESSPPPGPSADELLTPAPSESAAPAEAMPAEEAPAADDPFGVPAPETRPAGDDPFAPAPAEPTPEPAADDPFGTPAPEAMPGGETPAADDPFAPAPAEPDATPAADDPFAPEPEMKPEATPAADDPFAPAPEAKPEATPAADDPFAPAPEAKPDATPAADDPFAPAPAEKPAEEDLFAPAPAEKPVEKPAADDPFGTPAPDATSEPLPEPEQPTAPLGPKDVPAIAAADVTNAMQSTMAAGQQMMAAEASGDEIQLRKARTRFYVSLFGMADTVTMGRLGAAAAELDPQLQALEPAIRQQLAADPKQIDALRVFGARWFKFPKRPNNGVALVGTVESSEQVGQLFQTKAKAGSGADTTEVTIVTADDPQLAAGDEVLSLGSIVEQPAEKLLGYEGDDPAVVWSGMTFKLAPASN